MTTTQELAASLDRVLDCRDEMVAGARVAQAWEDLPILGRGCCEGTR